MNESIETRDVVRCTECRLVQFRTSNGKCRRCDAVLPVPESELPQPDPVPEPEPTPDPEPTLAPLAKPARRGWRVLRRAAPTGRDHPISLIMSTALLAGRKRMKGMTQIEAASKVGMTRPYLSRIERNKHTPRLDNLARLLHCYSLSLQDILLGGDGTAPRSLTLPFQGVGAVIKEARHAFELSHRQVEQRTGILEAWQSRIEHGYSSDLTMPTLVDLHRVLHFNADDLIDWEKEKENDLRPAALADIQLDAVAVLV